MDENTNTYKTGISFSLRRARVLIYHDTIRALGDPVCFRFLINKIDKKMAMQVCDFGEDGYHIVPNYSGKESKFSYEITSIELLRMIWNMCGWDESGTYHVIGTLYQKEKIVEFDLKQADRISDAEFEAGEREST